MWVGVGRCGSVWVGVQNDITVYKLQFGFRQRLIVNRQRLHPAVNVKYLGIKVNENFNWKHHVNDKLIRANAILFKLMNYVNLKLLRSINFAIFESHLN